MTTLAEDRQQAAEAAEPLVKRLAERAVQSIADSDPEPETLEAQDVLKGHEGLEQLFCLSAETITRHVHNTLSDAFFDGDLIAPAWGAVPRGLTLGHAKMCEYLARAKRREADDLRHDRFNLQAARHLDMEVAGLEEIAAAIRATVEERRTIVTQVANDAERRMISVLHNNSKAPNLHDKPV